MLTGLLVLRTGNRGVDALFFKCLSSTSVGKCIFVVVFFGKASLNFKVPVLFFACNQSPESFALAYILAVFWVDRLNFAGSWDLHVAGETIVRNTGVQLNSNFHQLLIQLYAHARLRYPQRRNLRIGYHRIYGIH